jgi:hypothetical protein
MKAMQFISHGVTGKVTDDLRIKLMGISPVHSKLTFLVINRTVSWGME